MMFVVISNHRVIDGRWTQPLTTTPPGLDRLFARSDPTIHIDRLLCHAEPREVVG